MACKAKESGKVVNRGTPSVEWYKNGKPQYYCYGYIDARTDDVLPECKRCPDHVNRAQEDLEDWNRRTNHE